MASSLDAGRNELGRDCLLNTSNVMYCEKCGFVSTDSTVFKQHMLEHMGTRFYCFYCKNVAFNSEAELQVHLQLHTTKYQFKCPDCGQGYIRRQFLVKHMERLHGKSIDQGLNIPDMTKITHVPVSNALPRLPSADASSVRPTVKITIPTTVTPRARQAKDRQRGKTVDTDVPVIPKVDAELVSPLNELVQHNRALTVSLPEEVTIPAGCLVELVEVKSVNGTNELKLRLVSQQENESAMKDGRTTNSQNDLGKPLSSTLNNPNTMKSVSMGMYTVNRKQCEPRGVNVEHPAVPANFAKNISNQVGKEKCGTKRTLQEMMNLTVECPVVPTKVSKNTINPMREGKSGIKIAQRETLTLHAVPPTVVPANTANSLTSILYPENMRMHVSHRRLAETQNVLPAHPKSTPTRTVSHMKSIPQDLQVAVKEEPGEICNKDKTTSDVKEEPVGQDQQSLESAAPSSSVHGRIKDKVTAGASFLTDPKTSAWTQSGRCNERAFERDMPEPEGFPVISSVFSLSQQPGDVQGSVPPLVMALRGIVMSKSNCSVKMSPDHIKTPNVIAGHKEETITSGHCARVITKNVSVTRDRVLTQETSETVKDEQGDKCIQHTQAVANIGTKEGRKNAEDNNKCRTPKSLPSTAQQEAVCTTVSHTDASVTEGLLQPLPDSVTNEQEASSRFLTVSLKRIRVGLWKQSKKRLKVRKMSKSKTRAVLSRLSEAVIHPTPLKLDQLVKRPSPNQPVVVLNHPKPQVPKRGARAATVPDTGTSEVPMCQILKMRLSKVMGQKYEVIGCTVRVFP